MSKSARKKQAERRLSEYKDNLRKTMGFVSNGVELKPGTREYEKALDNLVGSTTPHELIRRKSNRPKNA